MTTLSPVATVQPIVDWPATFAGAAIATAIALVLLAFGAALGLSVASPYDGEGLSPVAFAIAAGLYLLWVQLLSFGAGGYVAARLRPRMELSEHENDTRDALHGALMWAAGVIAAAVIATTGLAGVSAAARAAAPSPVIESVATVVEEEIAEGAVEEAQTNPGAAGADPAERRAEVARKLTVISAFVAAASLLVGLVVAIFMAGLGGRHRDESTRVQFFVLRSTAPVMTKPTPPVTP